MKKKAPRVRLTLFQRFVLFFFGHVKATALLWVGLVTFGVLSYTVLLQRQGFPNVAVPISLTTGTYFVNDSAKVDGDVVKPIADLTKRQANVKTVSSNAQSNFYTIITEYEEGTNVTAAQNELSRQIKEAGFLPANATREVQNINASKFNSKYDVLLALRGGTNSNLQDLVAAAERITQDLSTVKGVNKVTVLNPFKTGISPATGQEVTLQQTFDRIALRENGRMVVYPSVEIGVIAHGDTDAIRLEQDLQKKLDEINKRPSLDGYLVKISAGSAEGIKEQVSSLEKNLLEGLLVVIVICLLLISLRAGLIVALSMTTVLVITIGLLYAFGLTLNTITLFALVLCLGLIVDDTIIMAEAIDANKRAKAANRDIIATASKKVARASTAGTFTTMLAFAPMLFIGGILGDFIRVLPITIIISLAVSLLVSLTLIPFFSRFLLLSKKGKSAKSRNPVLKLEGLISSGLSALIRLGTVSRKKAAAIGLVAITISLVFLLGSTYFFQKLKFDIFPSTKDSNVLSVTLTYPAGTTIEQAEQIADEANTVLVRELGNNLDEINYLDSGSTRSATATVELVSYKKRGPKSPELIQKLERAFANFDGARIKVAQLDAGPPKDDFPFRVQVFNEDLSKANQLASDISDFLTNRTITRTNNTTAKIVRVELVGDTPSLFSRNDGNRLIEVQAGFDSDDTSALVTAARTEVEKEFSDEKIRSYGLNPDDIKFDFGSESENQDSFKSMLIAFPILLVVMYILLAFQFRSILQPLLIFTAIPFSFFGVGAGLYATDNPLIFFVMIGFFALIGIAVNNTILLTDYANQARKEGAGHFESMALAVKARFRPLLTTSLTSVVALIPLSLSDPFWEGLAFTLIFGLLSSTFLVIVAFPYYYLAVEFLRARYSRSLTLIWLGVFIAAMVAVSRLNNDYLLFVPLVFIAAMFTTWLKGFFLKRLSKQQTR